MTYNYINTSFYSADQWLSNDGALFALKINNYQVVTIFWNIFLALLPFLFGYILLTFWRRTGLISWYQKLFGLILWFVWVLFLPNAAYVISDVRHLLDYCPRDTQFRVCNENAWMPVFFFAYGLIGWITFVYGLMQMKLFIESCFNTFVSYLYLMAIIPLIALGLLLGLVNRFNSWDFFLYPGQLWRTISAYWNEPQSFTNVVILSILLYILYGIGYLSLKERFRA
ncbi:MAG: DUF1361 domain-containing protein [bacterium]